MARQGMAGPRLGGRWCARSASCCVAAGDDDIDGRRAGRPPRSSTSAGSPSSFRSRMLPPSVASAEKSAPPEMFQMSRPSLWSTLALIPGSQTKTAHIAFLGTGPARFRAQPTVNGSCCSNSSFAAPTRM
jgi:hypothetical protein